MQHFAKEIITCLARGRVEFVIVGGLSAVLQGVPIVTVDLDICYRRTPDNIARLAATLAPYGPRLRGLPPDVPSQFDERALQMGTNFTLEIGDEDLDLLGEMSGIGGYDQILGQTIELEVADHKVRVLSLAQLIVTKQAAGRQKDLLAIPLIKATMESQRENPTSHDPRATA